MPADHHQPAHRIKALIIDDKQVIGYIFNFLLGFYGHHVTFVSSPADVFDSLQKEQFDIIFCDIVMPEKNGIVLLGEIKEKYPLLPVVMMTGYLMREERALARELGAIDCLEKPFERKKICEAIKAAIGVEI
jgi:CheY-like chemotaxis protein